MKLLSFPNELYELKEERLVYKRTEESYIGKIELLWIVLMKSTLELKGDRDHKINRRLKKKIREFTRYQDKDQDSRIAKEGEIKIVLEEDEYDLLKKHVKAFPFSSAISEDADDLDKIIQTATDPKLELGS